MKIAVLGLGVEGKATLRFLKRKYPKTKIVKLDKTLDKNYLKNLDDFDIIYRTPGIPYNLKEIQRAIKKGVDVTSATEAFLRGARGTVIGITGTKGKSTTATLIYNVLKNAGRDVYLAGNIGKAAIDLIPKLRKDSVTVLELSSFQLQGINYSPHIAVVLDVFPDHLDAHKTFKEYVEAKKGIVKNQVSSDVVFYAPENDVSTAIAKESNGQKIAVPFASFPVNLKIPGLHNVKNAAMAAAVASYMDVSPVTSLEVINSFKGLPFRIKLTRKIGGVALYNDSASTNPNTTAVALASFPGKHKILVAGGKDKNLDYEPLRGAVAEEDVKVVVLFGENRNKIKKVLDGIVPIYNTTSLDKAIYTAMRLAESGDVILFSPGASSFDMFENYRERGKEFDRIVKKLKG